MSCKTLLGDGTCNNRSKVAEFFNANCLFLDSPVNSTAMLNSVKIFTCVSSSILAMPIAVMNGLVILTIWRNRSLWSPSNVLLVSLACADFMNGLLTQPLAVIHVTGELKESIQLFCIPGVVMETLAWFASGVSGTTVLALSIDRFCAVYMHLRYAEIITLGRVSISVVLTWIMFALIAATRFVGVTNRSFITANLLIILLCLVTLLWIYYKIFKVVNRHRTQISEAQSTSNTLNYDQLRGLQVLNAKKSVMTVVYIVGLFWLCYLPFSCVLITYLTAGLTPSVRTAYCVGATIVFANSAINPVLYCWRITGLRQALMRIFKSTEA